MRIKEKEFHRAGGEVVALDSGGYGPFTAGKSVTVTGPNRERLGRRWSSDRMPDPATERHAVRHVDDDQIQPGSRSLRPISYQAVGVNMSIGTGWHPDFVCPCGYERFDDSLKLCPFKFCPSCGRAARAAATPHDLGPTPTPWHWHDRFGRKDGNGLPIVKNALGAGPPVGQ